MEEHGGKYKVILVDDEPIILRSLKVAIPWGELNIEIVGEARNGEEALRLVRELSPHIVISDIRMPGIDGITLMKEVLAEDAKRLFIFISGYGEFEYAREALREGAFDYLLKPIDHDELTQMIQRARISLDKQLETEKLLHSAQALSMLAQERLFAELIEGYGTSGPVQHMQWLENSEFSREYFIAVIQLDHYMKLNHIWTMEERRLWLFAIRNIVNEWSMNHGALTMFPFHSGEWVMVFPGTVRDEEREALGRELIKVIKCNTKLSCSVGFSRNTKGIKQLGAAYHGAVEALVQRFYDGAEGVYFESGPESSKVPSLMKPKYPKHLEAALLECVRTLNHDRMQALFNEIKQYIESQGFSKDSSIRMLVELTVVLFRQVEHMQMPKNGALEGLLQELHALGTLSEMMNLLKDSFGGWILESRVHPGKDDMHALILKVQEYIVNNYHRDLGIEEVSEIAGLSISHFCMQFKQVTGSTFLEYLTSCRIDKAKYILKNSQVKVY